MAWFHGDRSRCRRPHNSSRMWHPVWYCKQACGRLVGLPVHLSRCLPRSVMLGMKVPGMLGLFVAVLDAEDTEPQGSWY